MRTINRILFALLPLLAGGWFGAAALAAQTKAPRPFEQIDRHALAAPSSAAQSLESLAAYLAGPARKEAEKARAVFRWITHNIAYDTQAYFSGSFRSTTSNPRAVLKKGTAVCDGYADLFLELARRVGLEARKIVGHAKGTGYSVGQGFAGQPPNHAWNVVKVDGLWRLVDATWGAGHVNPGQRTFVRRFEPEYFFTPPAVFAQLHFPENRRWQLLPRPLLLAEFEQGVFLRGAFFRHGLALDSHPLGAIAAAEQVTVTLQAPPGVELAARVLREGQELDAMLSYVEPRPGGAAIHALFPAAGKYTLRIFSRPPGTRQDYDWSADYLVRVRRGTGRRFPGFGAGFFAHGLELASHREGAIAAPASLTVTLAAPPQVELTARLLKDQRELAPTLTFVQGSGKTRQVRMHFPQPGGYTLRIFSRRGGSGGPYEHALDYQIQAAGGLGPAAGFPKAFAGFSAHGAVLAAPLRGKLPAGRAARFALRVPGATGVAVVMGERWRHLDAMGDRFQGEVTIQKGEVGVFATFPGQKQFTGLLGFQGE